MCVVLELDGNSKSVLKVISQENEWFSLTWSQWSFKWHGEQLEWKESKIPGGGCTASDTSLGIICLLNLITFSGLFLREMMMSIKSHTDWARLVKESSCCKEMLRIQWNYIQKEWINMIQSSLSLHKRKEFISKLNQANDSLTSMLSMYCR